MRLLLGYRWLTSLKKSNFHLWRLFITVTMSLSGSQRGTVKACAIKLYHLSWIVSGNKQAIWTLLDKPLQSLRTRVPVLEAIAMMQREGEIAHMFIMHGSYRSYMGKLCTWSSPPPPACRPRYEAKPWYACPTVIDSRMRRGQRGYIS